MPKCFHLFWVGLLLVGCASHEEAGLSTVRRTQPIGTATASARPQDPLAAPPQPRIAETPFRAAGAVVFPENAPYTVASSAIMIDARSGDLLFFKNPDAPRPVASTQKLLTALVIAENGSLDERVTVRSEDCRVEPTKLGFRPGEVYGKRQLLAAMMVHSCNDVAVCLARHEAGSVAEFADLMNRKAYALGATHSHFLNPNGLPEPGQYSTARDMARIAFVAYRNPVLRQYMRLPGMRFVFNSGRTRYLEPTNKLLLRSSIYNGMKTGFTNASGRCLISSANRGGQEVILVQLGGTRRFLFDDAARLLQWGLNRSGPQPFLATR